MIARPTQRRGFLVVGLGLAALAWALLAGWSASPWARFLEHGDWAARPGFLGGLCAALPGGGVLLPALGYAGGWLLMLTAMMLPTALPVLAVLERMTARRPDGRRLLALAAAGYLAAWAGFGLAAHLLDAALLALVRSDWPVLDSRMLALAGAFQLSGLKRRCLDRCRSPVGQVMARWRGRRPGREALAIGWTHGVFCVGCCWALMLVMVAVGAGSLGWMLALGLAMAAEKNLPRGRLLSTPLGIGLVSAAAATAALA
ncbi:MAG TPA: DUF2182 domain-containing protein [Amaricoccus sp.]|nr:DUF2182 domain-containing protein [Amaricoccus sp.]